MTMDTLTDIAPRETQTIAVKSSFYLAMRILEPARREAMFAIYTFCRAVDDIADDEGDRGLRRDALNEWRRDLDELYAGRIRARAAYLAEPIRRFRLDRADFEAIIDGMMMDVEEDICAPDWETLEIYCDRVASAVGRLSVRAFGLVENDARDRSSSPITSAAPSSSPTSCATSTRTPRAGGSICPERRSRRPAWSIAPPTPSSPMTRSTPFARRSCSARASISSNPIW